MNEGYQKNSYKNFYYNEYEELQRSGVNSLIQINSKTTYFNEISNPLLKQFGGREEFRTKI